MAILKVKQGLSNNLDAIPITPGSIYITTDTKKIYIDSISGNRLELFDSLDSLQEVVTQEIVDRTNADANLLKSKFNNMTKMPQAPSPDDGLMGDDYDGMYNYEDGWYYGMDGSYILKLSPPNYSGKDRTYMLRIFTSYPYAIQTRMYDEAYWTDWKAISPTVIDSLNSTSTSNPLSANQGRILKELIDNKMDDWQALPLGADIDNLEDGFYYVSESEIATQSETAWPPCLIIQKTTPGGWGEYRAQIRIGAITQSIDYRIWDGSWSNWSKLNNPAIIDNLTSTLTANPLSANQGRVLKELVGELIPFKHTVYGELTRTLQEQIGNINYMTNKSDSNNNLVAGINGVYNELNQEILKSLNRITSLENGTINGAITNLKFKVQTLKPGASWSVPINSWCYVRTGQSSSIISYTTNPIYTMGSESSSVPIVDSSHVLSGEFAEGLFMNADITTDPDRTFGTSASYWYHPGTGTYRIWVTGITLGSTMLTTSIRSRADVTEDISGGVARLTNTSDDVNAYIFYFMADEEQVKGPSASDTWAVLDQATISTSQPYYLKLSSAEFYKYDKIICRIKGTIGANVKIQLADAFNSSTGANYYWIKTYNNPQETDRLVEFHSSYENQIHRILSPQAECSTNSSFEVYLAKHDSDYGSMTSSDLTITLYGVGLKPTDFLAELGLS